MYQANLWQTPESETLTSFAGDSPVSPSVTPERGKAIKMPVGSGLNWLASSMKSVPLGRCWKTFLASFPKDLTPYSVTWMISATPGGRRFIRLARLGHRTDESASSLWPTPRANDDNRTPEQYIAAMEAHPEWRPGHQIRSLQVLTQALNQDMWPTPKATDGDHGGPNQRDSAGKAGLSSMALWPTPDTTNAFGGRNLRKDGTPYDTRSRFGMNLVDAATTLWPTPAARDWKDGRASQETLDRNARPLNEVVVAQSPQGKLNPDWVSQVMGFPDGWLDVAPLAQGKRNTNGKRPAPSRAKPHKERQS